MVETVSQGEAGRAIADEVRDAYMAGGAGRIMKQLVFARTRIQTLEAEVGRLRIACKCGLRALGASEAYVAELQDSASTSVGE